MKKWFLLYVFIFPVLLQAKAQNIVKAEYFWDTDPGPGSGMSISIAVPSASVNAVVAVSAAGLSTGIHQLYFRAKDATGKWGLFDGTIVLVTAPAASNTITQLEYFWDTDPGAGNATAITVASPTAMLSISQAIQAGGISAGIHNLYIRARDANGKWGLFDETIVLVTPPAASNVVKLEYFWDSDPGLGNGTSLTPVSPGLAVNENFSITAPGSLSQGNHLLVVRSRNAYGVWSLFELDTIAISGTLPLQWLSFSGQSINTGVYLEWTTSNEITTSYFVVERSANGISFEQIGKVEAVNSAGTNNYHFTDSLPLHPVNFYRLKQTDIDGRFIYSTVIRILNTTENNIMLVVSPNPASRQISIDYTTKETTIIVNIYDAEGRLVEQSTRANHTPFLLPVEHLRNGLYFIHLSDGLHTALGKFLKE